MATTNESIRRRVRIVGRKEWDSVSRAVERRASMASPVRRAISPTGPSRQCLKGRRHSSSRCSRGAITARAWRTSATSRSRPRHRPARQASPSDTGSRQTAPPSSTRLILGRRSRRLPANDGEQHAQVTCGARAAANKHERRRPRDARGMGCGVSAPSRAGRNGTRLRFPREFDAEDARTRSPARWLESKRPSDPGRVTETEPGRLGGALEQVQ